MSCHLQRHAAVGQSHLQRCGRQCRRHECCPVYQSLDLALHDTGGKPKPSMFHLLHWASVTGQHQPSDELLALRPSHSGHPGFVYSMSWCWQRAGNACLLCTLQGCLQGALAALRPPRPVLLLVLANIASRICDPAHSAIKLATHEGAPEKRTFFLQTGDD